MKKVLLVLSMIFLTINALEPQFTANAENLSISSFQFVRADSSITKGSTEDLTAYAEVINASSADLNVLCFLEVIILSPNHLVSFCWDICYLPTNRNMTSQDPLYIPAGETSGEHFHSKLENSGLPGISILKYAFYDQANETDRLELTIIYNAMSTGVEYIADNNKYLDNAFPNPAGEFTSIEFSLPENTQNANLVLYNSIGDVVYSSEINAGANSLNVSTSTLSSGTYYYILKADGKAIGVKKLVIEH